MPAEHQMRHAGEEEQPGDDDIYRDSGRYGQTDGENSCEDHEKAYGNRPTGEVSCFRCYRGSGHGFLHGRDVGYAARLRLRWRSVNQGWWVSLKLWPLLDGWIYIRYWLQLRPSRDRKRSGKNAKPLHECKSG